MSQASTPPLSGHSIMAHRLEAQVASLRQQLEDVRQEVVLALARNVNANRLHREQLADRDERIAALQVRCDRGIHWAKHAMLMYSYQNRELIKLLQDEPLPAPPTEQAK